MLATVPMPRLELSLSPLSGPFAHADNKHDGPMRWTADHVRAIGTAAIAVTPQIRADDFSRVSPDFDLWDAWPIQEPGGLPAVLPDGSTLWMALAAPHFPDPDERHAHARIHLLNRSDEAWVDLGPAMPDGFSPGSREWSGSAVLDGERSEVSLYFTAAGRRGEAELTFEQRIFGARASLDLTGPRPRLIGWRDLAEIVERDPAYYMTSDEGRGSVGTIKAFRDPAFFVDPADGASYIFFAGSAAHSASDYNGVVGAARADAKAPAGWRTLAPLVSADGLNNELERPHVIVKGNLYYLFWSTQSHVFDAAGPAGPTGLYGVVGESIAGPWRPINGSGLVFANPPEAPQQAYSWLVLPDLRVVSFVDDWGSGSERRFGATFAPMLRLVLNGDTARLDE